MQSEKGSTPVAASLSVTARAYTSAGAPPPRAHSSSGAMYSSVPT